MDWKLSLAGLLIGLLVGITGMGGGSLMTPLLVLVFGFKPSIAIGTDIVHGAIFKSFGAVQHRRLGHVHARLDGLDAARLGAVLARRRRARRGGSSSATATAYEDDREGDPRRRARRLRDRRSSSRRTSTAARRTSPFILTNRDRVIAVATGVVGGFVVGLTSVGSGTLFGLVMLIAFPLTAAKIVGTDIFHAAVLLCRRRARGSSSRATSTWARRGGC